MRLLKKIAFTLAEVLIVLGIIGIVAELTIPTLYNSFQKQVTVTKLQKFYSNMVQAIRLSEMDNGPTNTWNYGASGNAANTITWYNTYLQPYMKSSAAKVDPTADPTGSIDVVAELADGTILLLLKGGYMNIGVFLNGYNSNKNGKDIFWYEMDPSATINAFRPFDYNSTGTIGQRSWYQNGPYMCSNSNSYKMGCAGLIMFDGWKIADDYPW